eukprot:27572_1
MDFFSNTRDRERLSVISDVRDVSFSRLPPALSRSAFYGIVLASHLPPDVELDAGEALVLMDPNVMLFGSSAYPVRLTLTTYRIILQPLALAPPRTSLRRRWLEIPVMRLAKLRIMGDFINFTAKDLQEVWISLIHSSNFRSVTL